MRISRLLTAVTIVIAIGLITFYGCKKTSTTESKQQSELAEFYKQKLKNEPASATFIVNLPGKGYYGDINGNRITVSPGQIDRTTSTCPNPGESEFSQVLVSITREFTCNVGYRFVVQYKITSEFAPQLTNGGSLFSRGRIKLVNSSGGQVYITPTSTVNPVLTIQDNGVVGTNSNGDPMNEYLITYRSEIISEATYNLSSAVQSNLTCYTDCPNYATLNIGFSSQQQVIGSQQNTLPCTRIDKVYWNPRNGTTPPSLAGCNAVPSQCFPFGYVFPNKQEIEFKNGSNQWKKFYLHINGLGQPGTDQYGVGINYWDVWYIDVSLSQSINGLVPGNVQVRFRNNHMGSNSNGGPCVTQPNGLYVTETWYIN
ncbi:MAG: hypothetical protein JST23_01820 [Bacteroidetes bacterium]|nr:hypothetical protein [Bacteroidota bacterium]